MNSRPEQGKCGRRLRLPPHRTSSARLAAAYPFLAGTRPEGGVYVGVDAFSGAPACFDPWSSYRTGAVTNPNVLLTGVIGQGKSALAKSLVVRSIPYGRRAYIPCDVKGEWAPVARAVGGTVLSLAPGAATRLNPLDPGPTPRGADGAQWRHTVTLRRRQLLAALTETTLSRPLLPAERTRLDLALDQATEGRDRIALPSVLDALGTEAGDVFHALRRLMHGDLAGMFDQPTSDPVDLGGPMLVLDLSRLAQSGMPSEVIGVVMTCAAAWLESAIADPRGGQRWVVYDEAWRLIAHLPLVRRMQAQWKLSRAYGIANLLVLHRLSDLDTAGAAGTEARALAEGLLSDCSTRICYRQEPDQLARAGLAHGLTEPQRQLIGDLDRGSGLWKIGHASHLIRHRLHPDEQRIYDTDAAMTGGVLTGGAW
jgi:type IV secretory pathway VirB4 component